MVDDKWDGFAGFMATLVLAAGWVAIALTIASHSSDEFCRDSEATCRKHSNSVLCLAALKRNYNCKFEEDDD